MLFLLESSIRRINASMLSLMLSCPPPSSSFRRTIVYLCHLSDVRPYVSSFAFLYSDPFPEILSSSISRMIPSILQGTFKLFCNFCLHPHLFDGARFHYTQVLASFLFYLRSDFFLIRQFYSLLFFFFRFSLSAFSMPNPIPIFRLHILIVCIRNSKSCSFLHTA